MITQRARDASRRPQAGDVLLHPLALASLATLVVNDHVLKGAFPGLVTGKLSDIAGVVLLPLVLVAGWELVAAAIGRDRSPGRSALALAIVTTGVGFAVVKLAAPAAGAFGWLLGVVAWPAAAVVSFLTGSAVIAPSPAPIVVDPGDLIALPALAIAAWVGLARVRQEASA